MLFKTIQKWWILFHYVSFATYHQDTTKIHMDLTLWIKVFPKSDSAKLLISNRGKILVKQIVKARLNIIDVIQN